MSAGDEAAVSPAGRTLFRVGRWVLIVLTALFALNHVVGAWAFATSDDEQMMFVVFAALQALALVVLFAPYRRAETWAWWAMWIPILAMALTLAVFPSVLGVVYASVAGIMALAQFLALPVLRAPP